MTSIARLKTRIGGLLAQREATNARPHVTLVSPDNGRIPHDEGPWPRVQRAGNVTTVIYRLENGQPATADVAAMVQA
jgi:hypothetical protein